MRDNRLAWTCAALALVWTAAACGSDEDDDGAGGTSGSGATGGSGGKGGTGASGGKGGSGGSGGSTGGTGGVATGGATGTGGASGVAGTAGQAGAAGSGGCTSAEKLCGTSCVALTDPSYGCGDSACAPCDSTNGTAVCVTGVCAIACNTGYHNCDGLLSNGCERPTSSDVTNCGGCGVTCTTSCVNSICQCGNGTIDTGEDCDDGNTLNLDGCDSLCQYEMITRVNSLAVVDGTTPAPTYCSPTTNQFGKVFPGGAGGVIALVNDNLQTNLNSGAVNILIQALDLDDLTGVNDSDFDIALLTGLRDARSPVAWPTTPPPPSSKVTVLDYWFRANPDGLDSTGKPTTRIPATLTNRVLSVGPADLTFPFGRANLTMRNGFIRGTVLDAPAPDVPGPPPSQLASGLTVFRELTTTGTDEGMCGNITVDSLAKLPLPKSFSTSSFTAACVPASRFPECTTAPTTTSYGYTWCGEQCGQPGDSDYNASSCSTCAVGRCFSKPVTDTCNSFLDAVVGGCIVNPPDCRVAFLQTQPDVAATGGTPGTLAVDTTNVYNKVIVPSGQENDAYSGYFKLSAIRAHITNNVP